MRYHCIYYAMKICRECTISKPFEAFSKNVNSKDGLQQRCKECFSAYNRARYLEKGAVIRAKIDEFRKNNADRVKAWKLEWQRTNASKHRESNSQWYEANREEVLKSKAEYRDANREKRRKDNASYKKAKPHLNRAHVGKRRAIKLQAIPKWADHKKIEAIHAESSRLSLETGIPHHVDHIVPLVGKLRKNGPQIVCGLHWEGNLEAIPGEDNCKKGFYIWPDMP